MTLFILGIIILFIGIFGTNGDSPLHNFKRLIYIAGVILALIGLATSTIKIVPTGNIGIKVLFGEVQLDGVIHEGMNFVNPLMDVKELSTRTQNYTMSATHDEGNKQGFDAIKVLSQDGLPVDVDLTILYRVNASKAAQLFQEVGLDYENKLIRALTQSRVREGAAHFVADVLYSKQRAEFEEVIRKMIEEDFDKRGIVLENLLIRNISLPDKVKESIEMKIAAEQDAQRMLFVIRRDSLEAERKRVEARGVADAQKIVNEGLSDRVLQYETIKIQKDLVTSPNSKIIILGGGKSSMPFILDGK